MFRQGLGNHRGSHRPSTPHLLGATPLDAAAEQLVPSLESLTNSLGQSAAGLQISEQPVHFGVAIESCQLLSNVVG